MSSPENIEINETHLDTIDWRRASFPLGIAVAGKKTPWLALSLLELRTLHNLLTKSLPLATVGADGTVSVNKLDPAAEVMPGLATLSKWLEAVIAFRTRYPEPSGDVP